MVYMVGIAVVLQLYLKDMGASPFQVSLLEVVFWAALLIFSPLWGAMSDTAGRRKVFLWASVISAALVIPLFSYADTIGKVLLLRFGFSVLASAFPPVALAAMSNASDGTKRGKDIAPYHSSRAIGFLLGWGSSGLLLDVMGFRYTFLLFALTGVVGFFAALRIDRGVDEPREIDLSELWENAKSRWVPSIGDSALTVHGLHYLYAGIFIRKMAFIGIMSLIAVYAVDVVGLSASVLGFMLALNPLGQLLFIDVFGTLSDRYGRRKVFLFGFLTSIMFPFVLAAATDLLLFGVAYFILGLSFAAFVEGSTTFIGDVAPDGRQGEFMGFRKSFQGLAGVCGPLLAGYIATVYSFRTMLYAMGGLVFLSFLIGYLGTDESLDERDIRSVRTDMIEFFYSRHS